ncbi:uncharacterized protein VDAG_08664 [Verticillium dahliae VdLs.17]|uniref:Uncharacterized protein n=1 Tax=Verticillium dahliae (strain VdLs.17 / ATCC MYA-4575 / FGSC 10137) TaxID=498257 RepID=G2XES9_VERDV|nr:uncharacterized protein VDAG_08664 [Verticillium dahliae VdLs.17]EGY18330.1 hypothetical protein VDAG_08664 [Verticillium dahliae VdLs.17]
MIPSKLLQPPAAPCSEVSNKAAVPWLKQIRAK